MSKINEFAQDQLSHVILSVKTSDVEKIFQQMEMAEIPLYTDSLMFWTEHISKQATPGKKYYYCPTTRETSWHCPSGNVEIIPYLIPEYSEQTDNYLRVYSPPSAIYRKKITITEKKQEQEEKEKQEQQKFPYQNVQLHILQ